MKRRTILTGIGAGFVLPRFAFSQEYGADFAGDWYGVLVLGSVSLRLKLRFEADKVTLFSLDQGGAPINGKTKAKLGNEIAIEFSQIKASFKGSLQDRKIVGTFDQGFELPLEFVRNANDARPVQKQIAKLDQSSLDNLREKCGAPALIAANNSEILVSGTRAFGKDIKAHIADKWHIGSITKSFTALLVAKMVDNGIVKWETTIGEVFGEFAKADNPYKGVNFLHLLSHRSGMPGNIPLPKLLSYKRINSDPRGERIDYVKTALQQKPNGKMGEHFEYSNSGFVIAGAILEKLSGKSWEELMRSEILEPLGLNSAGFGAPGEKGKLDQPLGHSKAMFGNSLKPAEIGGMTDNPAVIGPAGTLHMSAHDMIKYLEARAERHKIVSEKSWNKLETPPFGGDYALGIINQKDGSFWHNGSNTLWYAESSYDPVNGKCGFAAANYAEPKVQQTVAEALVGILK